MVDAAEDTTLFVDVQPANDNGQAVLEYQLNVSYEDQLYYSGSVGTRPAGRAVQLSLQQVERFTYLRYGVNRSLEPRTPYTVRVRARNGIGWSAASAGVNCTASAVRAQEFPWIAVLVPTILVVLCLFGLVAWCYKKNKLKIKAPKLKKKSVDDDVLKGFVDGSATATEDMDPELVMNPVLVARMQMEKESKERGKRKKGKGGVSNKTGGLARLGLNVAPEQGKATKPIQLQVDEFLVETVGLEAGARGKQTVASGRAQAVATERLSKKAGEQAGVVTARGAAREAAYREKL
jgi:hypothetical protein